MMRNALESAFLDLVVIWKATKSLNVGSKAGCWDDTRMGPIGSNGT